MQQVSQTCRRGKLQAAPLERLGKLPICLPNRGGQRQRPAAGALHARADCAQQRGRRGSRQPSCTNHTPFV